MDKLPFDYNDPTTGLDWLEYWPPHNTFHPGVDLNKGIGNDDCGIEIRSPKPGIVEFIHPHKFNPEDFGLFVIMNHGDGTYTRHAHMQRIDVSIGDNVEKSDIIGLVGSTGTTYCHDHFEYFGEKLAEIQRNHWRKWRFYPVGKSKAWIAEHYINPWPLLRGEEETNDLKIGYEWFKENMGLSSPPKDVAEIDQVATMIERYHEKYHG